MKLLLSLVAILCLILMLIFASMIGQLVWQTHHAEKMQEETCWMEEQDMGCGIIEECYTLCDEKPFIQHAIECRTKYLPYIQACLGVEVIK